VRRSQRWLGVAVLACALAVTGLQAGRSKAPVTDGPEASLADLPLHEVAGDPSSRPQLVFFASGDGGWAGLVKRVAGDLATRGLPVVGLNSLKYLWHTKEPDRAAHDLERTLRHYLDAWKKTEIVLVGYSSGADILPFMATRLPDDLRSRVSLLVLVGPGEQAAFEFHFRDWFGMTPKGVQYPVLPELRRLTGKKVVCVSGAEEDGGLCPTLPPELATVVTLPGGHHVDGDYDRLAEIVIENLPAER
jgi:type IV secretory pathway VirJ component